MNKSYLIIGAADSGHVKKWAGGMKKNAYDVSIFTFYPPADNWYEENDIKVYTYFKNHSKKKIKKFLYIFAAIPLRKLLKNNYTLVNAHYASSYGFVSLLAGAKNLLVSYWGTDIYVFPKKNILTKRITKYILKNSNHILSSSHVMASEINKYTEREIDVVPFGIDLTVFTNIDTIKKIDSSAKIKIGIVKTLLPIYRIDVAIEAVKILSNYNIELHICGEGPLLQELKAIATEYIYFKGRISNTKVPDFIKSMDIMLNPTDFESFGVSIVEAMACGTPVIAHDAGGASEIITNNETGLLYSPNTAVVLSSKIEALINDTEKYNNISQNARKSVEANYDFQKNLNSFISLSES